MSELEWIAAALGLANVVLLVRRSVWNYPFGMAMVALYVAVFWNARLYGEAGLQVFFFIAQGWGWWLWLRAETADTGVPVRWLDARSRTIWLLGIAMLAVNAGWLMHRFTNAAAPFADGPITVASIAAQILLALRRTENWVLWIVIDAVSVGLYWWRGLYPTAGLYLAFLVLSGLGLREWMRSAAQGKAAA
ncbi:MAG: hypothetical protein RLZZ427_315 [Pseudomonadota bacterium]|jgi:nicotinamide mononucleotide transporter